MKAATKTAAVLTAILAGAIATQARPQQNSQRHRRQDRCPLCGQTVQGSEQGPNRQCQGQNRRGQGQFQGQQGRRGQGQNRRGQPQFEGRQGQRQRPNWQALTPQQKRQFLQRRQQMQQGQRPERGQRWNAQEQRRGGQARLNRQPQGRPQLAPEQKEKLQRRRQQILEKFDADGDGELSEKERNAAKRYVKGQRKQRDGAHRQRQDRPVE